MKRFLAFLSLALLPLLSPSLALAAPDAPDALIGRIGNELLDQIRADGSLKSGDLSKISALVDSTVMPHVDFQRMTALAVGRNWRQANPEQQKQLMGEFRLLLLRTYSGAVSSVQDQKLRTKPLRAAAGDTEVVVRSEILERGRQPIQLDYRLYKADSGWKIYDVNVLGVWLIETYRNQFAQEVSASGIDGLIRSLSEKNRAASQSQAKKS
jgi:phospholipid transport system substrate-binding protein